jgi:site-specific recombinase XerD
MIKNKKERYCNFLKEKGYSTHTISAYPRALEKFGKAIGDNIFTMIIPDDIESIEEKLSDKEYSMVNDNNGDIHAALMQYVKFLEEKEYDEDGLYIDFDDLNRVERLQFLDSNDANEINNVTELEKRGFKYVCSFSELVNEPANHKKIMKK